MSHSNYIWILEKTFFCDEYTNINYLNFDDTRKTIHSSIFLYIKCNDLVFKGMPIGYITNELGFGAYIFSDTSGVVKRILFPTDKNNSISRNLSGKDYSRERLKRIELIELTPLPVASKMGTFDGSIPENFIFPIRAMVDARVNRIMGITFNFLDYHPDHKFFQNYSMYNCIIVDCLVNEGEFVKNNQVIGYGISDEYRDKHEEILNKQKQLEEKKMILSDISEIKKELSELKKKYNEKMGDLKAIKSDIKLANKNRETLINSSKSTKKNILEEVKAESKVIKDKATKNAKIILDTAEKESEKIRTEGKAETKKIKRENGKISVDFNKEYQQSKAKILEEIEEAQTEAKRILADAHSTASQKASQVFQEADVILQKAKQDAQNIRDGITETSDNFSLIHHVEAFLYRLSEVDSLPADQLVKIQELHLKLGQTINAEVQFDVTQSTDVEHIAHQADKQELIALYLNKKIKAIEANEDMHAGVKEELINSLIGSLESELKKMSGLDKMD